MSRGRRSMHLSGRQQGTGVCHKAACRRAPMSWEGRDRCFLVGAQPNRFAAVATVFRGKDKLVLPQIKVTIRPAVVGAALGSAPAPPPAHWRQALAYRGAAGFPAAG